MAKRFPHLTDGHCRFIRRQRVFFTASAADGARVNVSPRSTEALRVLSSQAVASLDRTGSGNETAAHLRADGRLTLMFCAFEDPPSILRLYGQGLVLRRGTREYDEFLAESVGGREPPGARHAVMLRIDLVQTSCGFGVPLFQYAGERDQLESWAEAKGEAGLDAYRREKNTLSLDGLPTGLFEGSDPAANGA